MAKSEKSLNQEDEGGTMPSNPSGSATRCASDNPVQQEMPCKNASWQACKEDCKKMRSIPCAAPACGRRERAARSVSRGWVWRRAAAALPAGARVCVVALFFCGSSASAGEDAECARGEALRRSGSTRAALAAYKACVARGGGDAVTRHNLGVALIDSAEYEDALGYLESAVALQPLLAASYAGIGQALEGVHRCREAASFYRQAVAISLRQLQSADPFRALLLSALLRCPHAVADAHPLAERLRDSVQADDAIAETVPNGASLADWQLWLQLGTVALHSARCSEAVAAFLTCLRLGGARSGGNADDCHFGAAICATQNAQHLLAASLFQAASRRRKSPRRTLAQIGYVRQMDERTPPDIPRETGCCC